MMLVLQRRVDEALTCLREEMAPLFSSGEEGRARPSVGVGVVGGSGSVDGNKAKDNNASLGSEQVRPPS